MYGYQSPTVSTSWYRAPEVASPNGKYYHPIDLWSVGCMLYEFIFGIPLLGHITEDNNHKIMQGYTSIIPGMNSNINWDMFWKKHHTYHVVGAITNQDYYNLRGLLEGLLTYDPTKRLSATAALNHPVFAEFGTYIHNTRLMYIPGPDDPIAISTLPIAERAFCVNAVNQLIYHTDCGYVEDENRNDYRCLFHAVMLFDRVLLHTAHYDKPRYSQISPSNGLYWSMNGTYVRFMTCYYLSCKYFGLLKSPVNWNSLIGPDYKTGTEYQSLAEDFERYLVSEVCKYRIYQPTPLDIAGIYKIKLNKNEIWDLFSFYLMNNWNNATSDSILGAYMKLKNEKHAMVVDKVGKKRRH